VIQSSQLSRISSVCTAHLYGGGVLRSVAELTTLREFVVLETLEDV
jgi:hypothetical protein